MATRLGFEFLLVFSIYYASLTVTAGTVTYEVLNSPSISDFINIRYKRQVLTNISTTQSVPAITTARPATSPSTKSTTQGLGLPSGVTLPRGTDVVVDSHSYYTSTVIQNNILNYWIDLPSFGNHVRHKHLSNNHRVAVTLTLPFSFVFYGHQVKKVTIATGGFVYLSDFIHQWLVATQYVAPLMANFDTTLGDSSEVYYLMEANRLIVQWQQVYVKEHPHRPFTFQVHLLQDGTIYFVYKQVGLSLASISTKNHPVKVGTSDAFYLDQMIGKIRRRTIYEYHRIRISKEQIKAQTVILLRPLPTCVSYTDCLECLEAKIGFTCRWCSAVGRCSDGLDRHRQSWQNNKCSEESIGHNTSLQCMYSSTLEVESTNKTLNKTINGSSTAARIGCSESVGPICQTKVKPIIVAPQVRAPSSKSGDTAGVVLGLLAALLVIGGIVGFVFYAYKNPTTRPGQWLIKHRPSKWKFKFSRDQGTAEKYRVGGESTA